MKKLVAAVLGVVGIAWALNKSRAERDERDLWAEATDRV